MQGRLRLATALSVASTPDEVAEVVGRWAPPVAGSAFANLAVYDPALNQVSVVHGPMLEPEIAKRWTSFPIGTPTPLCTAILTGHPVLLGDLEAIERDYPALLDDTVAAHLQATASLPLKAVDGSTVGAIGLAWREPQEFAAPHVTDLEVIAELVARAIQQSAERKLEGRPPRGLAAGMPTVYALQEALLSRSLSHGPELEVAVDYLPASDSPMGGDWYDVFRVAEATCLVVGDIAGHGIEATAAMAELKHAIRAYATEDPTPSAVVARINRFVHRVHGSLTATLVVATWDPRTRTLRRCNAGHPPMLQFRSDRHEYLALARGANLMIGVDPTYEYHEEVNQLCAGTMLLLYSDGLVENPPESIGDTTQRLLDQYDRQLPASPQRLVNETLLWRLRQGPVRDDICLMAVRVL
jgi:serine phosphatase RsbU (regulator of sigma subunit)